MAMRKVGETVGSGGLVPEGSGSTLEADRFRHKTVPCCVSGFWWRSEGDYLSRETPHLAEDVLRPERVGRAGRRDLSRVPAGPTAPHCAPADSPVPRLLKGTDHEQRTRRADLCAGG